MGDIGFEEQLEQERLAREQEEARLLDTHPKTRTDPDGTVFEWDVEKKAWFPKVDSFFLLLNTILNKIELPLTHCMIFLSSADFFKANFLEKFFKEYTQGVKQFRSRLVPTFCWA